MSAHRAYILAVMPCLGRAAQTIEAARRLVLTAGREDWELLLVCDGDDKLAHDLYHNVDSERVSVRTLSHVADAAGLLAPFGYWRCMQAALREIDSALVVNLANDLLPGRDWLQEAVVRHAERFNGTPALTGFNDGVHAGRHSAHFLIDRSLLHAFYGAALMPVMYQHNYGDTEICERAKAAGVYNVAPFAVLYHNHPLTGGKHDAVYAQGNANWQNDQRLYEQRKNSRWQ